MPGSCTQVFVPLLEDIFLQESPSENNCFELFDKGRAFHYSGL